MTGGAPAGAANVVACDGAVAAPAVTADLGDAAARPLVVARGLVKRFGQFTAVDGVDVEIARGECFGFLGPNGAGKTSTMRMISCMSPLSGGTLRVLGMDPATDGPRIRARLGLVPQEDSLDLELTVLDNLIVYARYFDIPRAEARRRAADLLEFAQLSERAYDKVESLSGGMKRRLTIARALVSQPDLVILDEPTTGLDPQARHLLWDRLYRLKQDGVTLVVTTHYMEEAETLCDQLAIIDHGTILAVGRPQDLIRERLPGSLIELAPSVALPDGIRFAAMTALDRGEEAVVIHSSDLSKTLVDLVAWAGGASVDLAGIRTRGSSLEDLFLSLTGRSLRE